MNLRKQKCILTVVLLMTLLFSLGMVGPSYAQGLGVGGLQPLDPSVLKAAAGIAPLADVPAPGIPVAVVSMPKQEVKKIIGGSVGAVLWSMAAYAIDNITYQTAVWLASGGAGQKPLWLTSAGFDQLVDGAVGEGIYALGNNIEFLKKYGISLCVPPDLKLQMWLQLDLAEQWQPAAPHCSFKQIKEAWSRIDEPNYWKGVGVGFRPGQNDLSMLLAADQAIRETSLRKKEQTKEELAYRGKAVSPTDVSGQAKVPVSFIEKLQQDLAEGDQKVTLARTQSTAEALQSGDWTAALLNVGRIFTNTLASKLLSKAMTKGFVSIVDLFGSSSEKAASPEAQVVGGRQAAEIAFAEFLKPNLPAVEQWNYTVELSAECAANPSPYCGVMDNNLQDALAMAEAGGAITVKEALGKYLHGEWPLLPPGSDCPREAYCYENLVKLRQLRILPIGWELAAKASPSGQYVTLQQAIDDFSVEGSPYYHLIDPYWLLKAPVARCGAKAYSAYFLMEPTQGTGGQRGEYCADVQNCVEEDENGQCNKGSWGYCLKEKNRWILGGDSCDEQFNTCTTYANSKGQTASYLANTIEKSICSADNVGCRAYAVSSALDKDNKWQWDTAQSADKIYFNAKAAQCDYGNEGCSQFVRTGFGLVGGGAVSGEVNLKKAPEYYNCYGENLVTSTNPPPVDKFSSSTLQWAVNKADLSKIFASWKPQNKEKCDNFAQVCSYDEVGCEKYTPVNGDLPIPGILTANDPCPSDCVGYESFKQQDTNFEKAPTELAYFISTTAVSCQKQEAGCDEFVNLEAQTAGGESKEYYTELRQCSQIETDGAVYYTWEGSDTAGYQLKSFNLKFTSAADASPMSTVTSDDDINNVDFGNDTDVTCGPNSYKAHTASNDCREFYDKDGNKSYRLYTKTITVSATDCKKLRKTVSDEVSCPVDNWDKNQKICTYLAIPKEGQSCKATAVGCRAYKGNAGNNFYTLDGFPITFENGNAGQDAKQSTGWTGKFSAESTVVGGKSLKVDKQTQVTTSLAKDTTYSLSFWAKGLGEELAVSVAPTDSQGNPVAPPVTTVLTPFSLTLHADWQNYTVGPIVIDWDETVASSTLKFESSKVFYLDNIVAKQMNENVYVVKGSWKTPSACDNLLGDEYGQSQGGSLTNPYRLVPQAMLGCQQYTDRQNNPVAVKSFTSMCREEAVGCEEFVDTHNTATTGKQFINAVCGFNQKNNSNEPVDCKDDTGKVLCQVAPGKEDCLFNWTGDTLPEPSSGVNIGQGIGETIIIPSDNKVYLVNDKNYYCSADQLGCSALGPISYNAKNVAEANASAYLKNQPDAYGQILCEKAAEGCEEFNITSGKAYFKDPQSAGAFCSYKENFSTPALAGSLSTGWVRDGLGRCGVSANLAAKDFGAYCTNDSECSTGQKCQFMGLLPCNVLKEGIAQASYDVVPKNGDDNYDSLVGLCPAEQNGCSEFIDPMDDITPNHASGTPYFVINNSKLNRDDCGHQASLQEGCVLFNETSKGTLNWSASLTYGKSCANKNEKVNPVDCGAQGEKEAVDNPDCANGSSDKNTANTILKVRRDRVCGEWLACKSSMSVRDDNAVSRWKEMCTELAPCVEANSEVTTLTGKCGKWAPNKGDDNVVKGGKLTAADYKERNVTWWGQEYSGYTLPNAYQIQTLSVDDKNLGHDTDIGVFIDSPAPTVPLLESCRGYAQSDMPDTFSDGSTGACSYTKVTYSAQNAESITRYFPYNQLLGAEGVCSGGFDELKISKKDLPCVHSGNCTDDRPLNPAEMAFAIKEHGVCMLPELDGIKKARGWEGYCLDPAALNAAASAAPSGASSGNVIASEAKQSQPKNCTLWYPLTTPSGSVSSDHLYAGAGYVPPSGSGKYWCVQAKGNANINNTAGTYSYAYTAYQDARQFYPHTKNGFNGLTAPTEKNPNGCSDQTSSDCSDANGTFCDGQSANTCPGVAYKNHGECDGALTAVTNSKDADGNYISVSCLYDNSHLNTSRVGSELITDYAKDVKENGKVPLHISEVAAIGLIATGDYYNNNGYYDDTWPVSPLYVFRDQRLAGIENIKDDELDGRYWSGPLKKFGNYWWVMDLTWTVGNKLGGRAEEINYDAITEAVCAKKLSVGTEAAAMGFRAYFNADGQLEKIGTKICDAGNYSSGMQMDLVFYLSEVCTDIRQVVDTDNKAAINSPMGFLAKGRTDRLWSESKYLVGADLVEKKIEPRLDLAYNQIFAPFGSFSQSQNPVTSTLTEYTKQFKTSYAQRNALNQAGMWPIWTMPGGGTPLSCAKDNKGDCGQVALCESGPQKGIVCDPDEDNNGNGIPGDDPGYPKSCEWHPLATCDFSGAKECSSDSSKSGMAGKSCSSPADCQNTPGSSKGDCVEIKVCSDGPKKNLECGPPFEDGDNKDEDGTDWCNNLGAGNNNIDDVFPTDCYIGGNNVCKLKEETKNNETNSYIAYKCSFANTRGLCVGGQNHGQFCGGSLDCPPKKYSDSTDETTEYGVCVGAALDEGKVIPKDAATGNGFGRGLERLLELFPAWFNTWEWKDGHYTEYLSDSNQNKSQGQTGFHTFNGKYDYTKAKNDLFSGSCDTYPTGSCNPKANVEPKPPTVSFVDEKNNLITGNPTITGDGSLNFILRFRAWADHDQMPLVRLAVDWGDGTVDKPNVYQVKGWFKNRKKECNVPHWPDQAENSSCSPVDNKLDGCRIRFGDSSSACEEGYYQFTHIYECNKPTGQKCTFIPRVQALDNWGWCNGTCNYNGVSGCWDDPKELEGTSPHPENQSCSTDNTTTKDKHWSPFSGTIELTP